MTSDLPLKTINRPAAAVKSEKIPRMIRKARWGGFDMGFHIGSLLRRLTHRTGVARGDLSRFFRFSQSILDRFGLHPTSFPNRAINLHWPRPMTVLSPC